MSINSSEPKRLVAYTETVASPVGQSETATQACRDAVATHNGTNPSFPVDTSAIASATAMLSDIRSTLTETTIVAAAFVAADQSGGSIRTASTPGLANAIGTIVSAQRAANEGPGSDEETASDRPPGVRGFYREDEGKLMIGGHEIDMRGDILLGLDWEHESSGPRIKDGEFTFDNTFAGALGARLRGEATTDVGDGTVTARGELLAGLQIDGGTSVKASKEGVIAQGGIDAMGGLLASGEVEAEAGPVSGALSCKGGVGAGAAADGGFEISKERIGFNLEYGYMWGLGGTCETRIEIDPGEAIEYVKDGAEIMHQTVKPGLDAAGDIWDSGWQLGKDIFSRPTVTMDMASLVLDGLD